MHIHLIDFYDCRLVGRLVGWSVRWMVGWSVGQCLFGWSAGWLFGCLIGCLVDWLVGSEDCAPLTPCNHFSHFTHFTHFTYSLTPAQAANVRLVRWLTGWLARPVELCAVPPPPPPPPPPPCSRTGSMLNHTLAPYEMNVPKDVVVVGPNETVTLVARSVGRSVGRCVAPFWAGLPALHHQAPHHEYGPPPHIRPASTHVITIITITIIIISRKPAVYHATIHR